MKVAIPVDGNYIAPTFDFAGHLLVVSYKNGKIVDKQNVAVTEQLPSLRAARLKALEIDTLLCGAISNPLAAMVWHHGINIISGLSGAVETVLNESLSTGTLMSRYTLPGCSRTVWKGYCRRARRRFRGGR
jgi:predicted Fe-Mo cluster-binding NifX family protein